MIRQHHVWPGPFRQPSSHARKDKALPGLRPRELLSAATDTFVIVLFFKVSWTICSRGKMEQQSVGANCLVSVMCDDRPLPANQTEGERQDRRARQHNSISGSDELPELKRPRFPNDWSRNSVLFAEMIGARCVCNHYNIHFRGCTRRGFQSLYQTKRKSLNAANLRPECVCVVEDLHGIESR